MASNAKNVAELLNTDTTVKVADIEDGSVTTAKLAADAVTTAKISDDAVTTAKLYTENLGRRNLLINGAFNIAQRGTSSTTANYTTVDRWRLNWGGGGTLTQAQHTLSSSDTPYTLGFRKSYHATVTSASNAAGTWSQFEQHIEAQNIAQSGWNYTSSSSKLTFSYWVKSSLAGTFYTQFRTVDGTSYYYNKAFTLAANTWTKITCTVPGNSNLTINDDNGHGFSVLVAPDYGTTYTGHAEAVAESWYTRTQNAGYFPNFAQDWSNTANATFEITATQLEVGDAATPFEHRSFGEEISLCQRYYTKSWEHGSAVTTNPGVIGAACVGNVNRAFGSVFWPVEMRATPTVTWYSGSNGTVNKWRNGSQGTDIAPPSAIAGIGTKGYGFVLSSGIVGVTDTLQGHYEAAAEL